MSIAPISKSPSGTVDPQDQLQTLQNSNADGTNAADSTAVSDDNSTTLEQTLNSLDTNDAAVVNIPSNNGDTSTTQQAQTYGRARGKHGHHHGGHHHHGSDSDQGSQGIDSTQDSAAAGSSAAATTPFAQSDPTVAGSTGFTSEQFAS